MKYVVVSAMVGSHRVEFPVIFPNAMVHAEVASCIGAMLRDAHGFTDVRAESAGDVLVNALSCSGNSSTLKLSSRPGDRLLINTIEYSGGVT